MGVASEVCATLPISGSAATMEAASKKARLLIHNMNKHVIAVEENSE
jgi:hypothetical protein